MNELAQVTIDVCAWFLAPFAILCAVSWAVDQFVDVLALHNGHRARVFCVLLYVLREGLC